jgi:superfamily I DNA/RNA helicase
LANDFKPVINKKGMVDIEEVNLLYVAMTRAMSSLRFKAGHCLEDFLFQYNQKQKVA